MSDSPATAPLADRHPAAAPTRVQRKRAERVARIERVAAGIFAKKGYDNANFDDIAAELDLRGPSLYHYVSSKQDLFARCLRYSADQVFERLRCIARDGGSAEHVVRALILEQVLAEVRDFPEFVPLFFKTAVPVPALRRLVLRIRREHAAIFEEAVAPLARERGLPADSVRVWLGIAFGALAYLPEWYDPRGPLGPEQLAEAMADTLLSALVLPGLVLPGRVLPGLVLPGLALPGLALPERPEIQGAP